jgi:imidazolonepropionase-like amidohydrolase
MRFLLLASLVAALSFAAAPRPAVTLAITGVTLIDGTDAPPRRGVNVLLSDDRIVAVGTQAPEKGVLVLDGSGHTLVPGLWDSHVHLTLRPEPRLAEDIALPLLLAHGVVGVRDMGAAFERIRSLRAGLANGTIDGPATLLSPGPFVDGPPGEASPSYLPVDSPAAGRDAVAKVQALGADFVKVQAALSLDSWRAVADEAKRRHLVFAGHVPEAVGAGEASDAGQATLEHLSPSLPGDAGILLACSSREAELRAELLALRDEKLPVEERRSRDRALRANLLDSYDAGKAQALFAKLARNRTVVVPTLVWSRRFRPIGPADDGSDVPLRFVPAATRARWAQGRGDYLKQVSVEDLALSLRTHQRSVALAGELHRAGVTLLAGTDSFDAFDLPGDSLHEELELLVQAGLSPQRALQAATRDAARALGQKDSGTIEPGKRADLLLLAGDPLQDIRNTRKVHAVVAGGKLYTRAALDTLLQKAAAAAEPAKP